MLRLGFNIRPDCIYAYCNIWDCLTNGQFRTDMVSDIHRKIVQYSLCDTVWKPDAEKCTDQVQQRSLYFNWNSININRGSRQSSMSSLLLRLCNSTIWVWVRVYSDLFYAIGSDLRAQISSGNFDFFSYYAPSEIKFSKLSTVEIRPVSYFFELITIFVPIRLYIDPNLGDQNSDAVSYPVVSNIEFVVGISI